MCELQQVLLVTLEDESDFEVAKASAAIIKRLKTFLLKYKINEPLPETVPPRDSAIMDTRYVKVQTYIQPDKIKNYVKIKFKLIFNVLNLIFRNHPFPLKRRTT